MDEFDSIGQIAEIAKQSTANAFPNSRNVLVTITVEQEGGEIDVFAAASPNPMEHSQMCVLVVNTLLSLMGEDGEFKPWK